METKEKFIEQSGTHLVSKFHLISMYISLHLLSFNANKR